MGFTSFFRSEFANRLRNDKHFLEWARSSGMSEKMLRNSQYTSSAFREFVKCVDIKDVKPCSGWKRRLQMDEFRLASEFADELEKEGIRPFVSDGSLIGTLRHQGFIPWDDDMDFQIINSDYHRMIEYCKKHHHVVFIDEKDEVEDFRIIDDFCSEHMGALILIVGKRYAKLTRGDTHVKRITIDYFPVDYIKDGADYHSFRRFINDEQNSERENPYISDVPTSRIYPRVDLTGIWELRSKDFLPTDYVFPLQKKQFETGTVWCPAFPEKIYHDFLSVLFEYYPNEFATFCLPTHEDRYEIWFRNHGIKAEILISSEEELEAMIPLYDELRSRNVFTHFINRIPNDKWGFTLDKYEVRWSAFSDFGSQYAVAFNDISILDGYKNEKLTFSGSITETADKISVLYSPLSL